MIRDKLSGRGIMLRRKRLEDISNDYIWRSDPELSRMDAAPCLNMSIDEFKKIYEKQLRYPSPDTYRFAIDTDIGKHIGNCMCYNIDIINHEAEVGIMIGNRDYWYKGHGYTAMILMIDYLFSVTSLRCLYLHTLEWNTPARQCFQKCGFTQINTVTRNSHSFTRMELTKNQWQLIGSQRLAKIHKL